MKTRRSRGDDSWEEELEKEAEDESAREKARGGGVGNKISIRKARFSFDGEVLGKEMECVIVDFVYLNTFYDTKFDEENPGTPACFALSEDGEDVAPHDNAPDPQADRCEGCPKNEWGSGKGRAKACAQRRRLALIHKDDLEDPENATVAVLELPPTSVANWSSYVKECRAKMGRPVYAVIAKLAFDTDESYPKVTFEPLEKVDDKEVIEAIKERRDEIREMLMTPFESSDEDKPARKKRRSRDDDDDDEKPRRRRASRDDDDDEDDRPRRRRASKEDDDDDEEDEKSRRRRSSKDDDDDDEEDDKPRRRRSSKDDDDDEEDEKPRKRRGSRFGK